MFESTVEIEGLNRSVRRLRRYTPREQRKILRASMRSSTNPIKTALRRQIRSKAVRFGHLLKAVVSKVKVYSNTGNVVLLVGVRDRRIGGVFNPGKYFHLVDAGTRSHFQPNAYRPIGGRLVKIPGGAQHPGSRARDMRRPAANQGGPKTQTAFLKQFERQLNKVIRSR